MKFKINKEVHKIHTAVEFRGQKFFRQTNHDKDNESTPTIKWFIGDPNHELVYKDNRELWDNLEHRYKKEKNRR